MPRKLELMPKSSNLWEETIDVLHIHSLTWDDVIHIYAYDNAGIDYEITKDNFKKVAKHTNYVHHFYPDAVVIDNSIVIVGKDFYLERVDFGTGDMWMFRHIPNYTDCPTVHVDSLLFEDMRKVCARN